MNWTERRKCARAMLAGSACVVPASIFDPTSARLAEELGQPMCSLAGSAASFAILGAPDLALMTLTEFADHCHRINRSCTLPLFADADHGYGNALNVMRTIQELETVGVAALTIEDTHLPLRFGTERAELISIEEGAAKMRAAVAARQDPDLIIIARTNAFITNRADALERVRVYSQTGVDGILPLGVKTREQIDMVRAVTALPLIHADVSVELRDLEFLASRGVRFLLRGQAPFIAAAKAVFDALAAATLPVAQTRSVQQLPDAQIVELVSNDAVYRQWLKEFVGSNFGSRE